MSYLEVLNNLTEGTFVKIIGMEVKNENDIFVVDCDYRIKGKYAVCYNQRCLRKVKINGEQKTSGYNIVFLDEKTIKSNPNINIEIVTDLKASKKAVSSWLKGVSDEEIVISFEKSKEQEVKDGSIVRFPNGIKFGTFGEKYISNRTLWKVMFRQNGTISVKELGKKGQEISTGNMYGCNMALTQKMIEECEVLNKIETKRSELNKDQKVVTEQKANNITQIKNEKLVVEQKQENTVEHNEENHTQESPVEQKANNITVTLNEEKNGIEIKFEEKPSEEVRTALKANGFRWSKIGIWYAKQSEERITFANSLVNSEQPIEQVENNILASEQVIERTYPTIDINDIDTYTVDQKLSDRENSISIFRSKDRNHQKELQEFLQSANNEVIELFNLGCNAEIEYKAKTTLQSFKKKYYELFIKMLTHRANNPSWAVTGRGNLNVNRYNKKQEQYNKMLGDITNLTDEFNNKMKSYDRQIKETGRLQKEKEIKEYINKTDTVVQVEKTKVNINISATTNIFNDATFETTAYHFDNKYFIIKHWGYWRIYDKTGNELRLTKATIKTLTEAKDQLKYIIANELNSAAV